LANLSDERVALGIGIRVGKGWLFNTIIVHIFDGHDVISRSLK